MSEDVSSTDWAQLVCVTDIMTPPFLIGKDKFTIGRARDCDICHENNAFVSGIHCYILRDDAHRVWLYDNSTNGTLLNSKIKLTKGECQEIEHGDEFYVVHKKKGGDGNIGYVFQDLDLLQEEAAADNSGELDQTLTYNEDDGLMRVDSTIADNDINQIVVEAAQRTAVKRRSVAAADRGPEACCKKTRTEEEGMQSDAMTVCSSSQKTEKVVEKHDIAVSERDDIIVSERHDITVAERDGIIVSDRCDITVSERHDIAVSESPETASQPAVRETGDDLNARVKKDGMEEGGMQAVDKENKGKTMSLNVDNNDEDVFAETLTCIICQELLHDCISLQPCMHSFCAGCYSDWMAHSSNCPSCRSSVDRINKNHIVNNLLEAYLKEHPEKRRPEDDIKELEAKNKITRDMLYPGKKQSSSSDYDSSDDDENNNPTTFIPAPSLTPVGGTVFGFGTPFFGTASAAFRAKCRQCPGSGNQASGPTFTANKTTAATVTSCSVTSASSSFTIHNDQPSTSSVAATTDYRERDRKMMPVALPYTCAANQNHVLCQCCLQIFPDRRAEHPQPAIPPQQCTICYRAYCHAYWGCRRADCNGCLAKLQDMNFGRKILQGLILDNPTESEIFANYLETKELAVRDVLDTCLAKMMEGSYTCPDQAGFNITGETALCFTCALRNFKALAYQYRADIPNHQLPEHVRIRPDCYWGKHCRTQRNKPAHALRFNHICEKTRT